MKYFVIIPFIKFTLRHRKMSEFEKGWRTEWEGEGGGVYSDVSSAQYFIMNYHWTLLSISVKTSDWWRWEGQWPSVKMLYDISLLFPLALRSPPPPLALLVAWCSPFLCLKWPSVFTPPIVSTTGSMTYVFTPEPLARVSQPPTSSRRYGAWQGARYEIKVNPPLTNPYKGVIASRKTGTDPPQ